MIDLILGCFVVGVFYGGFWCGAKYGTLKTMFTTVLEKLQAK